MSGIARDLRYALHRLARNRGFTLIVVLTVALGIGATTAIFSIVQSVLLRPLPYVEPNRLVTSFHNYPSLDLEAGFAVPTFRDVQRRTHIFESFAVTRGGGVNLTRDGRAERLEGVRATADYFRVFGVRAALGRTFVQGDDQPGHDKIVVLSDGLWRRQFGGRRDIIGTALTLDGEPFEVVGVAPAGFRDFFSRNAQLWRPLAFTPEQFADDRRTNEFLQFVGRVRPGMSLDQATRDMHALGEQLKHDYRDAYPPDWSLETRALSEQGRRQLRPALLVLLGAVGLVLLIACFNLANLLLARATGRTRELAVRTAIGATRGRLVRQLLTESLVLSMAGGLFGIAIAFWTVRGLIAWNPSNLPWLEDVRLDAPVLLFALGLSILTGVFFGTLPALYASKTDLNTGLREGGRTGAEGRHGQRVRRALVVAELALALMLLVGAGLLIRSFDRLMQVSPGFNPDRLITFNIALPETRYTNDAETTAFWDALMPRLAAVPGAIAVGATSTLPFSGDWSTGSFRIEGYQPPRGQPQPWGDIRGVSPGYHKAMGIRLLKGRYLSEDDRAGTRRVAVVDDEMVRRYWRNQDPIGKRLTFGDPDRPPVEWIEVVGVVAHTAHEGLDAERRVQLYGPYSQVGIGSMAVVVRSQGNPTALVNDLRTAVFAVDRGVPIFGIETMDRLMESAVGQRRLSMVLLGTFAGLALLLAALGIYGVISFDVTRRTQELGIRMALGAGRQTVLRLVLSQGVQLATVGLVLGLIGAAAGSRLIESQLFGIHTIDPLTFVGVAALLGIVALAATLLPALRATRVDPMEALRYE
jgi:putative ABC transport system permease protein